MSLRTFLVCLLALPLSASLTLVGCKSNEHGETVLDMAAVVREVQLVEGDVRSLQTLLEQYGHTAAQDVADLGDLVSAIRVELENIAAGTPTGTFSDLLDEGVELAEVVALHFEDDTDRQARIRLVSQLILFTLRRVEAYQ